MKFQTTPTAIKGKWRYQAQFQDQTATKRATEWLASRPSNDWKAEYSAINTNDLQVIFELRIHFDHVIKVIRQVQPA